MLAAKAKLLKRLLIPGAILATAIAVVGLAAPALKAWNDLAPMRQGHIVYIKQPCARPTAPGVCPAYRLDVFGDGKVIYRSLGGTSVEGSYTYRVSKTEIQEYMRDLSVSAFWRERVAEGPDANGSSCGILLNLKDEVRRNGCLKWPPGSDQAGNDPSVSDTAAQLEALTRVNGLARQRDESLMRIIKPYTTPKE